MDYSDLSNALVLRLEITEHELDSSSLTWRWGGSNFGEDPGGYHTWGFL